MLITKLRSERLFLVASALYVAALDEPPTNKLCTSLFANYKRCTASVVVNHELQLSKYLSIINDPVFDPDVNPKHLVSPEFSCLRKLLSIIFFYTC